MKPRRRYFASVLAGFALLVVAGSTLHYFAGRRLCSRLAARISALESALASKQDRCAVERESVEGTEDHRSEAVGGYSTTPVVRPRILGSGRCASWLYSDVAHADGTTLRYYIRTNATPSEVHRFVGRISDDARVHAVFDAPL